MSDESAERRGRMLRLQADAEQPAEETMLARGVESQSTRDQMRRDRDIQNLTPGPRTSMRSPDYYLLTVAPEMAEARLGEWSDPVRFKFEMGQDGHLELWMKVEITDPSDIGRALEPWEKQRGDRT